jgi:hypothetical protein
MEDDEGGRDGECRYLYYFLDPFDDALFASAPDKDFSFEEHAAHCHSCLDLSTSASSSNISGLPTKSPHRYC